MRVRKKIDERFRMSDGLEVSFPPVSFPPLTFPASTPTGTENHTAVLHIKSTPLHAGILYANLRGGNTDKMPPLLAHLDIEMLLHDDWAGRAF